jgi:hypothetical protein
MLGWALCAILAYTGGGYLIEDLSWQLDFSVTLPLGLLSLVLAMRFLQGEAKATGAASMSGA